MAYHGAEAVALGRHPQAFLASAIDPPGVAAVETAMEQLAGINAVDAGLKDRLVRLVRFCWFLTVGWVGLCWVACFVGASLDVAIGACESMRLAQ